jgi:NAD-dependent dihydropyrimidine dehydrogenase PreA subunit
MPYVIGATCVDVKDATCVEVCPVDCIFEAGRMYVVDPVLCIDCSACLLECPVDAIMPDEQLPAEWAPFIAINAAWRDGGREAVDTALAAHLARQGPPD